MQPMLGARRIVMPAWTPYRPFFKDNVRAHAPLQAGVYKIAVNLINGHKQVIYVGQSTNLASRLVDHLSEWECNLDLYNLVREYQCSFALAILPRQDDRNAAERALYLRFRPCCNLQEPMGPTYIVAPLTSA